MNLRKRIAMELSGVKVESPYSPFGLGPEQRFDRMWESEKNHYYNLADKIIALNGG